MGKQPVKQCPAVASGETAQEQTEKPQVAEKDADRWEVWACIFITGM